MAHVTEIPSNIETPKELGAKLRAYRERKGLTLEKLAGVLTAHGIEISPSMISMVERGASRGSFGLRRRLFDFLGEGQG